MYKGLTIAEYREYKTLSTKLFKGNVFIVFSEDIITGEDFKRYNELMNKKLNYIREKLADYKKLVTFASS